MNELDTIRQELVGLTSDPDAWLKAPNEALGDRSPLDLIRKGQGSRIREIINFRRTRLA